MSAQTLLITGAKGTVGNYVVTLAEMAGYRVIASDLTASGISVPVRGDVRPADLRDRDAVRRVVQGCDAVIHTAAQLSTSASPAELAQVNTDATAQLYEAARQAGVKRFVHMSTATLYAPDPFSSGTEEASVIAPRGAYGMSKHGAEIFLLGQRRSPAWTILRAAPLYGRRGRHLAASLLVIGPMMRLGSPLLPYFRGGPRGAMVHAEDVARALLFVLSRDDTAYQVYNVADGDALSLGLLFTFVPGGLARFLLSNQSSGARAVNADSGDILKVGLILLGVFFFVSGAVNALREVQWLFMSDSTSSLVSTGVELVQFALGCCLVAFAGKLVKRLLDHNASENQ